MAGSPHGAAALSHRPRAATAHLPRTALTLALATVLLAAGQVAAHQAPPKLGLPLECTVGRPMRFAHVE